MSHTLVLDDYFELMITQILWILGFVLLECGKRSPRTLYWIRKTGVANLQFDDASHWRMIDILLEAAHAIGKFFKNVV